MYVTDRPCPPPQPCAAGDSAAYVRRNTAADDVVIVAALRTPLTKAKRGGLKDTDAVDLLATVFKAVLERTRLPPADIGDIVVRACRPIHAAPTTRMGLRRMA